MIDMKKKETEVEYPYCLKMHLNKDVIDMLGMKEMPAVEQVLNMQAVAKVVGVRSDEMGPMIEIQIVEMGLEKSKQKVNVQKALYGESESETPEMED